MNFVFFVFIFGAGFVTAENSPRLFLPDYRDHPCIRSCEDGGKPMRCEYFFTVEWYHTLTKACYDCPFNKTDCYRPHCVPADGAPRAILVINRLLPGPAIQVCEGDEVVVTLKNKLGMAEGTTIHWHGIHQKGTQYMDGVEMLTQCPVPAYSKFEYKFKADTPGTHFWHSHAGLQRSDGMFGAFVVRQSASADRHYHLYDYDLPEHYILISDWLTETTISKFTHHHHDDGDNKPKSMLVNGMGTFQNYTDKATGAVFNTPHAEFYVQQGKRYRFRIMSNGILNCPIMFSIDNHMLTVIASDGAPFEPFTVDSVVVFAGERFDFILTANETVANYWIRLQGLADCGASFSRSKQTAILRYNGAPAEEVPPGDTDFFSNAREGKQLNPLNSRETPNKIPIARMNASFPEDDVSGIPDKKFYVAMDFYKINNKYFHDSEFYPVYAVERNEKLFTPQMNRISMTLPPSPPLSQLDDLPPEQFCNAETVKGNCTEEHCECTHVLKVDLGDLVELVLLDEGVVFNANHPTHLHGYAFRVVGMDRLGEWTSLEEIKRLDEEGKLPRNLVSPPMKDSVTVPDGGYTIIRFNANNPGFWLMHCHIAFHVEIGMALVIQVGDKKDFPKVPKNFPRCGDYHFEEHDADTKPDKCVVMSKQTSLSCNITTLGILTLLSTLGLLLL